MDFGDLHDDKAIQDKLTNFHDTVAKVDNFISIALNADIYDKLTVKEKVDYDLFMTYALNTLYWLYLRSRNEDPNKSEIKEQLNRVKTYMIRAKQVLELGALYEKDKVLLDLLKRCKMEIYWHQRANERQTIRPKIDQDVAERFVKHGIQYKRSKKDDLPLNKRMKFAD